MNKPPFPYLLPILIMITLLVPGCGRKRAPVPPGTLRPERIRDLSYEIIKDGAILSWTAPYRNHDGSPLIYIKEFLLYKAQQPIKSACLECPPRYSKPIVIKFDARPRPGQKIIYEDTTLRQGYYYTYQVKTVKGLLNVSDFSNKVSFAWHSPPASPENLSVKVEEEGVRLKWLPPTTFMDGTPLKASLEYNIFRRFSDEEEWTMLPGTTARTSYFDEIRRTYRQIEYKVWAIFDYHGTRIHGPKSPPITVQARGFQNLSSPSGLTAKVLTTGVYLSWNPLNRPGIVGYYVYRKGPSSIVIQLNTSPVSQSRFLDKTRLLPGKYTYWVTAIDDSYPPNESRPSKGVSITIKE